MVPGLHRQFHEILVVDDNSPEKEKMAIQAICKEKAVRCICLADQGKRSAPNARNIGVYYARGEVIFFADGDYSLRPDAIERMIDTLMAGRYGLVYGGIETKKYIGDSDGEEYIPPSPPITMDSAHIPMVVLIRRDIFPSFDVTLKRCDDWDFFLTLAENAVPCACIPEILVTTIAEEGDISQAGIEDYREWKEIVRRKHLLKWEKMTDG